MRENEGWVVDEDGRIFPAEVIPHGPEEVHATFEDAERTAAWVRFVAAQEREGQKWVAV